MPAVMHHVSRAGVRAFCSGAIALALLTASRVEAGQLLRWKLKPGDVFRVEVTQHTTSETALNDRRVKMSVEMEVHYDWSVNDVLEDGTSQLTQTIKRLRVVAHAGGREGEVAYDSALPRQEGQAAGQIASALSPLVGAGFSMTMSNRGQIANVKMTPETQAAAANLAGKSPWSRFLSPESLVEMAERSAVVLPERDVDRGDSWAQSGESPSPLGPIQFVNTYTLEGTDTLEGKQVDTISLTAVLQIRGETKTKISQQSQQGRFYFDSGAGRLVEARLDQKLVSETPYRDMAIQVEVQGSTSVRIRPVEPGRNGEAAP